MTELKCCLSRAHMAAETVPLFINVLSFLYVVCTKLPDQKCYILSWSLIARLEYDLDKLGIQVHMV